jgi:hypothetical protein
MAFGRQRTHPTTPASKNTFSGPLTWIAQFGHQFRVEICKKVIGNKFEQLLIELQVALACPALQKGGGLESGIPKFSCCLLAIGTRSWGPGSPLASCCLSSSLQSMTTRVDSSNLVVFCCCSHHYMLQSCHSMAPYMFFVLLAFDFMTQCCTSVLVLHHSNGSFIGDNLQNLSSKTYPFFNLSWLQTHLIDRHTPAVSASRSSLFHILYP